MGASLTNDLPRHKEKNDLTAARIAISEAIWATVIASVAIAILSAASAAIVWIRTEHAGENNIALLILVTGIGIAVCIPLALAYRLHLAWGQTHLANIILASGPLFTLLSLLALLELDVGLPALICANVLGPAAPSAIAIAMFFRRQSQLRPKLSVIRRVNLLLRIRTGSAFLSMNALLAIAYQFDLVVLSIATDQAQVAQYSLVLRAYLIISQVATVTLAPLWPWFAQRIAAGDMATALRRLRQTTWFIIIVGAIATPVLTLVGGPAITYLLGSAYAAPPITFAFVGLWTTVQIAWSVTSSFLNAASVISIQVKSMTGNAVLNLGALFLIAPKVGTIAAPIIHLTAFTIAILPALVYSVRQLRRAHALGPTDLSGIRGDGTEHPTDKTSSWTS